MVRQPVVPVVPQTPDETLAALSIAERHLIVLAHYAERDYIVRAKCRYKRAKHLGRLGVFDLEEIPRSGDPWIRCTITPHGRAVAELVLDALKRLHFKRPTSNVRS